MLRASFALLTLVTIGWFGYWWVGSTTQETALKAWLEDRRANGWVADYTSLNVEGFPSRFDAKITDLNLADPRSGWAWKTPEFQVLMLSYKPNHAIAVWPHTQTVATPDETIQITSEDIRASIKFDANTDLALNSAAADLKQIKFASNAGWTSDLKSAKLATRQTADVPFSHDLFFQADEVKPARIFKKLLDPKNTLPDVFDKMRVDITAGFDAPWDRHAIEGRKPEPTSLTIKDFSALWGKLEFQATGTLTFDTLGYPTGKISVRAKNWKDMIALGVSSGAIPSEVQHTLETGLGILARLSGNPDTIDAPLSFANRSISIGPIPIGAAPKLRLNP